MSTFWLGSFDIICVLLLSFLIFCVFWFTSLIALIWKTKETIFHILIRNLRYSSRNIKILQYIIYILIFVWVIEITLNKGKESTLYMLQ